MTNPTSRQSGRLTTTKAAVVSDMTKIWPWAPHGARHQDGLTVSRNVALTPSCNETDQTVADHVPASFQLTATPHFAHSIGLHIYGFRLIDFNEQRLFPETAFIDPCNGDGFSFFGVRTELVNILNELRIWGVFVLYLRPYPCCTRELSKVTTSVCQFGSSPRPAAASRGRPLTVSAFAFSPSQLLKKSSFAWELARTATSTNVPSSRVAKKLYPFLSSLTAVRVLSPLFPCCTSSLPFVSPLHPQYPPILRSDTNSVIIRVEHTFSMSFLVAFMIFRSACISAFVHTPTVSS
jgi:hypothetical protein